MRPPPHRERGLLVASLAPRLEDNNLGARMGADPIDELQSNGRPVLAERRVEDAVRPLEVRLARVAARRRLDLEQSEGERTSRPAELGRSTWSKV